MKIEIFIVESEKVMVDRTFIVQNGKAPEINMQELVDLAADYIAEDKKIEFANQVDLSPNDPALRDIGTWDRPHEGDSHIGSGDEPF